jgi:hypothetical protein
LIFTIPNSSLKNFVTVFFISIVHNLLGVVVRQPGNIQIFTAKS